MPSSIVYSLGYQWAWTYSILYLHSNVGFTSYTDHYIMPSSFYSSTNNNIPFPISCMFNSSLISPSLSSSLNIIECNYPLHSHYLLEVNTYLIVPIWSSIRIYCFSLDVIHSLSFYSFGFKIDAIPGRINLTSSLRSLVKGVNRGFCYELCGEQHNTMLNTWIQI